MKTTCKQTLKWRSKSCCLDETLTALQTIHKIAFQ